MIGHRFEDMISTGDDHWFVIIVIVVLLAAGIDGSGTNDLQQGLNDRGENGLILQENLLLLSTNLR